MSGIFILVEGRDDVMFVRSVVEPLLLSRFAWVKIVPYAQVSTKDIREIFISVRRMEAKGEARVIHFADMDSHRYPCITARKQAIQQDFDLRNDEIQIVIEEIESWYYAGVDETNRETLGVMSHDSTDRLTKEAFNELVPSSYGLRTDFLEEILKHYSFDSALRRNRSFAYFVTKYGLVMPDQSPVSSA